MRPELQTLTQDLRWRIGLLVLALLTLIGSACALWVLQDLRRDGLRAASQDAQALAQSVAQQLAQQLGRAVRLGIPLPELPGVPAYLQAALQRQPMFTRIAIEDGSGQLLYSAAVPTQPGQGPASPVRVPIAGVGASADAGAVLIDADAGASLQRWLLHAYGQSAALVLGLASAAALLAAWGVGAPMERQRRQVLQRLQRCSLDPAEPAAELPMTEAAAPGLPALAQALAQGDAQLLAARRAVQDYAHELLAMDFDGRLRADIERCVPGASAELPARAPE